MGDSRGRTGAFAAKELRELLRDRRAVFIAFVLPVLVYPVIFSFMTRLERQQEREQQETVFRVAVSGEAESLRERIAGAEGLVLTVDADDETNEARVRDGLVDLWVEVADSGTVDTLGVLQAPALTLHYHGPGENSGAARERVRGLLEELRKEERERRFAAAGGRGPLDALVSRDETDVATEEETGGAQAGRLVPYLLIFTLFMGAAPLAIDTVAGEKERGTLETLYLTPVRREEIARAKFLVVAGGTMLTGVLNLASLVMCYRLGLIGDAAEGLVLSDAGILRAFILVLPLAWMVGGLLLGISAFARSQKEAQYYVMPVMLMAFVPGVLSMTQDVKLDGLVALVPLANVSIALRDALLGGLAGSTLALVSAASLLWTVVVVRWTAGVLSREDTILGFDPEPAFGRTLGGRRRAAIVALAATVLIYFYAGQLLQAWKLVPGLALSLWVLLPLTGALALRFAWAGGRLGPLMSWRRPRVAALLGAGLLGLGSILPMFEGVLRLQNIVLPAPEAVTKGLSGLTELPLPTIWLLVALSPAVCEELVFRGMFLGVLRRTGTVRNAVLISSLFFAVIHLNVFRLLPTFLLGMVIALIVVRTRSLFPAMVFHLLYNGTGASLSGLEEVPAWVEGPAGWILSLAFLAAGTGLLRSDAARSSAEVDDAPGAGLAVPLQTDEVDARGRG